MTTRIFSFVIAFVALGVAASASAAATITNRDGETHLITVTEGSDRSELTVEPEQTVDFCATGCFITLPNGDRQALQGDERLEIVGGIVSAGN